MKTKGTDASRPHVLIVDDDESVRTALQELMLSVGLDATCFASTRALLDAGAPRRPGCLTLDVRMPGSSGLDLQNQLAGSGDAPPIIFRITLLLCVVAAVGLAGSLLIAANYAGATHNLGMTSLAFFATVLCIGAIIAPDASPSRKVEAMPEDGARRHQTGRRTRTSVPRSAKKRHHDTHRS